MTEVESETQELRVQVLASYDLATTSLETESEMTMNHWLLRRTGTGIGD